jgi:hypothetical protein
MKLRDDVFLEDIVIAFEEFVGVLPLLGALVVFDDVDLDLLLGLLVVDPVEHNFVVKILEEAELVIGEVVEWHGENVRANALFSGLKLEIELGD